MKILKQITILLTIAGVSELLASLINPLLPLPGSVIGIVILLAILHYKILPLAAIEDLGDWLTNNMSILFIPNALSLMDNMELLEGQWTVILIILGVTGLLTLAGSGYFMEKLFEKEAPHD